MTKDLIHEQSISRIENRFCLGKLQLRKDRLEIRALTLTGFVSRSYTIAEVASVTAVPANTENNFFIKTSADKTFGMKMKKGAMLAAHVINDYLGQLGVTVQLPGSKKYRQAV